MAQMVEDNVGLGHTWQKIMCLLTVWRVLMQSRALDKSLTNMTLCNYSHELLHLVARNRFNSADELCLQLVDDSRSVAALRIT